jgi:excisionase family DNA binding protein
LAEQLLTLDEAAEILSVSRWTVFRLAKQRQLVSILVATRCRRVTAASVQAYITRQLEEAA